MSEAQEYRPDVGELSKSFQSFRNRLQGGDESAAQKLFATYSAQLLAIARSRLSKSLRAKVCPDDVVQSAFKSFYRKPATAESIHDWDGLFGLLIRITHRKCSRQIARYGARKRDASREVSAASDADYDLLDWARDVREPTPDDAALLRETIEELLGRLSEHEKPVLTARLEGHETEAIAGQLNRTRRTVERHTSTIKSQLLRMAAEA